MKQLLIFLLCVVATLSARGQLPSYAPEGGKNTINKALGGLTADSVFLFPRKRAIEPTMPMIGRAYFEDSDSGLYFFNGAAWVKVSTGTTGVSLINTGYGVLGGPISSTGTLVADTATLFSNLIGTIFAGTGISFLNRTIVNTAPDQTVVLNNGSGINVTGTYPNFTITNTGVSTVGDSLFRLYNDTIPTFRSLIGDRVKYTDTPGMLADYARLAASNVFTGTTNTFSNIKALDYKWGKTAVLVSHQYRNELGVNNDGTGFAWVRDTIGSDGFLLQKTGGAWVSAFTQGGNTLTDYAGSTLPHRSVTDGTYTTSLYPQYVSFLTGVNLNVICASYFAATIADSILHNGYLVATGDSGVGHGFQFATVPWVLSQLTGSGGTIGGTATLAQMSYGDATANTITSNSDFTYDVAGAFNVGFPGLNTYLELDAVSGTFNLGDKHTVLYGNSLAIGRYNTTMFGNWNDINPGASALEVDFHNMAVSMGDLQNLNNGTTLTIDDPTQLISATKDFSITGGHNLLITGSIASSGARALKAWLTDLDVTNTITGSISGNAATVTTNANLTGVITSIGNATSIASQTGTGTTFAMSADPAFTGTPTAPTQTFGTNTTALATTEFVQSALNSAVTKAACDYATTGVLPAYTYSNGSSGVGATITGVSIGLLTTDGVSPAVGKYLLVKNETSGNAPYNGIYVVTVNAVGSLYVLTRRSDFNSTNNIAVGDQVFITSGNTLASTTWEMNNNATITVGTTNITFAQVGGAGYITASSPLSFSGTALSIGNLPTSIFNSGTSASSTTFWRGDGSWTVPFTLTTSGSSGAATFSGGTLNIPTYSGTSGTVTSVTANALSPIFTTSVSNPTTTPSISYSLSSAGAYAVLCNTTNASAAPVYSKIDAANMMFGLLPDGNISSATNWNTAYNNRIGSFTTTGSSGAATFTPGGALNVPTYTAAGLGALAASTTSVNAVSLSSGVNNTVPAAAGTLTGATLNSTVTTSSLTGVGVVTSGTWSTGAVIGAATVTLGSDANFDIWYRNSGVITRLAAGTDGNALVTHGTSSAPTWTAVMTNPLTTNGDIIYGVGSTPTRLAIGGANTVLHGGASAPAYSAVATGDIAANAVTLAKLDASTATARKALLSQSSASPIWSTETWAVPSTSGNVLSSDGTNWVNTVAYNSANSASTIVQRDPNNNCFSNDFSIDLTSLATAASTTTLTVSSDADYRITGSTPGKIIKLPSTNTLTVGKLYTFKNLSSVAVTFQSTDGTAFSPTLAAGSTAQFQCNAITNAAGTGEYDYYSGANTATYTFTTGVSNSGGTVTNDLVNGVDGTNIVTGTTTGIKIGTATTQKLGFFNSTPIVQPTGDVITALQNLGLGASLTLTSFVGVQVVTATGAGTYTPTAGAKSAYIWLVGSGGGGGGVKGATSSAGGGGGGGAGSVLQVRVAALSGTYSYTVGVHGTGGSGTTPSAGGTGGSSVLINGGTTYVAPGGTGGSPCTATSSAQIILGGAGGIVATSGDVNGGGDNGKHGESLSGTLGYGGAGGSCLPYGSGGIELTVTGTTGNNAVGKGSGGSGGYRTTNANSAGGDGTDGILIIMEFK